MVSAAGKREITKRATAVAGNLNSPITRAISCCPIGCDDGSFDQDHHGLPDLGPARQVDERVSLLTGDYQGEKFTKQGEQPSHWLRGSQGPCVSSSGQLQWACLRTAQSIRGCAMATSHSTHPLSEARVPCCVEDARLTPEKRQKGR